MIDQLRKLYNDWNQQTIQFEKFDSFIEITTSFVDMHHDFIQLFLTKEEDFYIITDDGHIINELDMLGIDIHNTQKRKEFINMSLKIFGVKLNKNTNELYVTFQNINEYPEWQNRLIQCLLRISDMLMTSRNNVVSIFTEEISSFFLDHNILFNEGPSFIGVSGKSQRFDFSLPRSRTRNEKLIKAINSPSSESYREALFSWLDIKSTRINSDFLVIANDNNKPLTDGFLEPFINYEVEVLRWSDRNKWVDNLRIS